MSESLTEGDQREVGDLQECVITSGGGIRGCKYGRNAEKHQVEKPL